MCRQSAYMMERRRSRDQELEDGREEKDLLRERMTERRVPSFPGDETEQKELKFQTAQAACPACQRRRGARTTPEPERVGVSRFDHPTTIRSCALRYPYARTLLCCGTSCLQSQNQSTTDHDARNEAFNVAFCDNSFGTN